MTREQGFSSQSSGTDPQRLRRNAQGGLLPENFGAGLKFVDGKLMVDIPIPGTSLNITTPLKVVGESLTVDMDEVLRLVDEGSIPDLHHETHWENGTDELLVEDLGTSSAESSKGFITNGSGGVNLTTDDVVTKAGAIPLHGVLKTSTTGESWLSVADSTLVGRSGGEVDDLGVASVKTLLAYLHSDIGSVGTDDHHTEAHTVASHSDTTATGTELETLTDSSNADALHTHSAVGAHTIASHSDTTATGTELETLTDGSDAGALHTHALLHADAHTVASHSDTTATGTELETLTDGSAADSLHTHANLHAESHAVASHSDTTATGAELETLTDGSNADSLHAHADFSDATFRVQDNLDATKEIAFQASGITTSTVRTVTMPDANVDLTNVHAESHTVASHSDTTATGAELETLTDGSDASSLHTHTNDHAEAHTVASHSDTTATGAELETLTDGSAADALHTHANLHAEAHTVASHSDTTATGAELETLTDGSDAGALHTHALLHADAHTVASHSDTTATGTELETLTDGSNADALHIHEGTAIKSTGEAGAAKFLREDGDGTCSWQSPSGSGDVVGPGSAVDDRIATFDGTTGKLIQDGGSLISDLATSGHTHALLHAESHTIASHSDTTATGTELETLTDGSDADALHTHSADGIDTDAFHSGGLAEFSGLSNKGTPTNADPVVIEDAAASYAKKKCTIQNLEKAAWTGNLSVKATNSVGGIFEHTVVNGSYLLGHTGGLQNQTAQEARASLQVGFCIWAEENAALANSTYEWSLGNGGVPGSGEGFVAPYAGIVIGMGLFTNTSSSASVRIEGSTTGTLGTVSTSASTRGTMTGGSTAFVAGESLNFYTVTAGGASSGPNIVNAFIVFNI